jgi:hypothetical protein
MFDFSGTTNAAAIDMSEFESAFLTGMRAAFSRRARFIGYHGTTGYEFEEATPVSWFTFRCSPAGHPTVLLTVDSTQLGTLLIRSISGKNMLALRGIQLVDNADAIVRTFERTLDHVFHVAGDAIEAQLRERVFGEWKQVPLRVTSD